jgi:dehydrogenase/reductase SDR family member 7B
MVDTPLHLDQQIMATNYFGPVALTKALLPSMLQRRSGCFVVVSSLSGKYGVPQLSAYSAAKHALHGSFECLRAEVHDQGIQITIVIPGFVRTPILENALKGDGGRYGKTLPAYERGMDPDVCATRILRAVARRKEEALIGGWELSSLYLKRFFPTLLSVVVRNHPVKIRNKLLRFLTFGIAGRDQ